jgi:bla regulator protein blaR1
LLAERFKLKVHRATQDGNVYALTVAKSGLKIKLAADPAAGARGGANGRLIGKRSMPQLATLLSGILRRPVIDQTGLAGVYEFTLEWTPEVGQTGPDATPPAPAPGAPSIFTAVQEQLGLKLDSAKAPIELVVVDSAERHSEN